MTPHNDQHIFLDELARRWRQDADRIVELAIRGDVPLWIAFTDVYAHKAETKTSGARKRKSPAVERHETIEVRPSPEVLMQIQNRCDRMLITAELPCLDGKGKPVTITNSVGEEWGETSMVGLKPAALFARSEDVARYERKNKMVPHIVQVEHCGTKGPVAETALAIPPQEHPCFAPELHAAAACWHALFARAEGPAVGIKKADILAWLAHHFPALSQAARERIALVVTPGKSGRHAADRQIPRP
jgi:hypothetical protein